MKVRQILIFVVVVIAMLGLLMWVFPRDGIKIGKDFVLHFPTFSEFFAAKQPEIDIDSLISVQFDIDEIEEDEELSFLDIDELKKMVTSLEFPEENENALDVFFEKLNNIDDLGKLRIMHYGDSQIEGDRITAFFRSRLQNKFGGYGMGLNTVGALYSQFSIVQTNSDNWKRYQGFIGTEKVRDKKYGAMISFSRFSPMLDSADMPGEDLYTAWIDFKKSDIAYANTKQFKKVRLFYSNAKSPTQITLYSNEVVLLIDSLYAGEDLYEFTYQSPDFIENIRLELESYDSPDFYAISFEGDEGIFIDNIAMRGSSGTVFSTNDVDLLSQMYSKLGVDLFILQFGGNVVPYIKDKEAAKRHANNFASHIFLLRRLVPDACVIVIGPSDMSTKDKEDYITYPILPDIVDALRDASHRAGAVYWDMFTAMGGENSMVAWVNASPQLAGQDYTHFTPNGTSVIANMFYNAFILEYNSYIERNKTKE
ncbi:MAG: hypothetical protein GX879_05970 [Bacteroidales bacterium]|nr:hypothetical protein [Bacteroidales bacterium]